LRCDFFGVRCARSALSKSVGRRRHGLLLARKSANGTVANATTGAPVARRQISQWQ
jgi:hypothetical protein